MGNLCVFNKMGENMMKKIIAVSSGTIKVDDVLKSAVNNEYIEAILLSGGSPITIPISNQKEAIKSVLNVCDGLILSGGVDVDPILYHEDIQISCGEIDKDRDEFEMLLIECALELHKPILGICRGHQMLNVYFGGSLYQDIHSLENVISHVQKGSRGQGCQQIMIEPNSFLGNILGTSAYVNSYHHQAVFKVAENFKVTAQTKDGVVEGIEHCHLPIYGVQFHPEVMVKNDLKMLEIFKCFINHIL